MDEQRDSSNSSGGGDSGNFTAFESEEGEGPVGHASREHCECAGNLYAGSSSIRPRASGDLVLPRLCDFPGHETGCLPVASIILRN
jgi:hypothetical protein